MSAPITAFGVGNGGGNTPAQVSITKIGDATLTPLLLGDVSTGASTMTVMIYERPGATTPYVTYSLANVNVTVDQSTSPTGPIDQLVLGSVNLQVHFP